MMDTGLATTGDEGLDYILRGGLPRNAMYLLQGIPGSGKTTMALQFLLAGARKGEKGLYVTLSETREEITRVAASHGWSLDGLDLFELSSFQEILESTSGQSMFHPAEVELAEVTRPILDEIDRLKPMHVVIDSLSEIRLLSGELLRFRRQVLALKQFFAARQCTVLLLDDRTADIGGSLLESLAHGVLTLERESPTYGRTRRRITIDKLRGVAMREGYHDFRIETGGSVVYPRLVAAEVLGKHAKLEPLPSGIEQLDHLLEGGPDLGTSTLLLGPSGVGKSSVAIQYAIAAASRGESAAIFLFDETVDTACARSASLGMPLDEHLRSGLISIRQLNPAELTAGEFSHAVRNSVNVDGARVVVVDSLNGFIDSVTGEDFTSMHLRELLTYLNHQGVATFTLLAQHGMLAKAHDDIDVSYLADNVIQFRYFEAFGEVRRAISVVKKRSGAHERTIREFTLSGLGLQIGEPIREFTGVLSGEPRYVGATREPLLDK